MGDRHRSETLRHQLRSLRSWILAILSALFWLSSTPTARGSVTGSISGTVVDASGAVVPGANVSTLCIETGVKESTSTNAQGAYTFPVVAKNSIGHKERTIHKSVE